MNITEIQNLIKELIEKSTTELKSISVSENDPKNLWFSVEVGEPHLFISHGGEGVQAINHLVRKIVEAKNPPRQEDGGREEQGLNILVDINGFQKKHIENIKAVAHMMSERARYFKSDIEVDPMSAFERRIIHEFLAEANDLKTESMGTGRNRRVVIKYTGSL